MKKAAEDISKAFSSGMEKGSSAQDEEKFLGFIPLPPGVATGLMTVWNTAIVSYSDHISDFFFKHTHEFGDKTLKISDKAKLRSGATIAANSIVLLGAAMPNLTKFLDTQKEQHKKTVDITKRIAPVLEEITGKRSVGAFNAVSAETNEVIFAARRRINDTANIAYTNHFIGLVDKLPILAKQVMRKSEYFTIQEAKAQKDLVKDIGKLRREADEASAAVRSAERAGVDADEITRLKGVSSNANETLREAGVANTHAKGKDEHKAGINLGPTELVTAGLTPILGAFQNQNKKRFDEKTPAFTALDMIVTLERQVSDNPDVSSYDMPKGGKSSRGSLPLTEYVAEIIRHHQLDMEAIDPEYTPVRKALDGQLKEIAEPIAHAIKKGDISTLALIRMVGEGQIVKNKGRSLAKPSEVKVLLEKMSGNTAAYTQLDPKEYFADAAFNKKELKEALDTLKGVERESFAAMFPDTVLLEAGLKEAEIKDLRTSTLKTYETSLGKVIMGLAAEEDKALHDMGLAKEEVKEIRDVADKVRSQGDAAVHEVRAKPNNPIGIERLVANAAVGQILAGHVDYMGKLSAQASVVKLQSPVSESADVEAEAETESHTMKITPNKKHGAEHAETTSHAAKQMQRRELDSEEQEVAV